VLTGDKAQTAINVLYSCQLIRSQTEKMMIDGIGEGKEFSKEKV